jgi:hypothetical protein
VFYVPVEEIPHIKVGQEVIISALGQTITGQISTIYPSADMMSKKVPVEVKISKLPAEWKLGMYITGYPMNEKYIGLIVPQSFIRYEYGKPYVFVKEGEDFKKVYVQLGKCDNDFCIVKSGLKMGDVIK